MSTPTGAGVPGAGAGAGESGNTPLSEEMFPPENGLLYMAEDLPVFGIWGDA